MATSLLQRGRLVLAIAIALLCAPVAARATIIEGTLPAAIDRPEINCLFKETAGGTPYSGSGGFNVGALFATGYNGILLSQETVEALNDLTTNIVSAQHGGETVQYSRRTTSGTETYHVSQSLHMGMAPSYPGVDVNDPDVYYQPYGPCALQLNPSTSSTMNIVGTPAVAGKVVVIDPTPLDGLVLGTLSHDQASMRTYINTPGVSHGSVSVETPTTNRHVKLSLASLDGFTQVTPDGAAGPTLAESPFIGPNPLSTTDDTPAVKISLNGRYTTGSFLLDTGSETSTISTSLAESLHVRYTPGDEPSPGNDSPTLELYDPANPGAAGTPIDSDKQFILTVPEIGGGTKTVAGFYLHSLHLPTLEGDTLRYFHAPVLVNDITFLDPVTDDDLTLDGIFGMNFLSASGEHLNANLASLVDDTQAGAYNWITYDQTTGILGLDAKNASAPQPGDANGDRCCNQDDLDIVLANYNSSGKYRYHGDFNGDGSVNGTDLNTVLSYYNQCSPEEPDPVPEPSSLALVLGGCMLLWLSTAIRRSRRRKP